MMPDFLPVLSAGAHRDPSEGACVMEYVSFLAGEPFTDRPKCTWGPFIDLAQRVNDSLSDAERQKMVPLIPRLWNTADPHWRTQVGVASYILRRLWDEVLQPEYGWLSAEQAKALTDCWEALDRIGRGGWLSWTEAAKVCAAATAATAAAAATTAAATAATAAAAAAATAATAAATAATTAATTTAAAAATATATTAAVAAAAAATVATATATAAAAASWYANDTWLHSLLVGALDVFDRLEGRTAEDLTPERLQQLCALTRS